jgi:TolB-like protein/Flp pilus assembly protein TadD
MAEVRKLAAILAADIVGFSRLAGVSEDRTLARLRALRSDLIDPTVAVHNGRVVKRVGDGILIEFRSVVDAVRCAIEVQHDMAERNAGLPHERRIEFRVGIHLGDVVEESDGDLMGDGINIAVRLESICEPNSIYLTEDAYRHIITRIDLPVRDLGTKTLKNILHPVRVYSIAAHAQAGGPPRLSIVVLPFANIGGDPEQEYFVDGVTESLTTDLSRIAGSFVIARNTAFTYKGKPHDASRIGHELNIRYVLEGSVQRGGNRIRVNVQIIDTQSGAHLWAERFDKASADFFDLQDEIVARLANALNSQLIAAEARRAERAPHPDSMDLYFEGMYNVHKGQNPETLARARLFFEQALALDPNNLEALVGMAMTDTIRAGAFLGDDRLTRLVTAETALDKVLSLAPNHASAHYWIGAVQSYSNRAAEGIAECQRALELDRNLAIAHGSIGYSKFVSGRGEETEGHVNEALRLSPRDTYANLWMTWVGAAKMQLKLDEEAIVWLRRAVEANRNRSITHFILAAALAQLGRLQEGRSAVQAGLALDPTFTISRFRIQASSDNPRYLAERDRIMEGMRQAGVHEG